MRTESFPAGPCEATKSSSASFPCMGPTKEFKVHYGSTFDIEAKQGSKPNCGNYECELEPIHFVSNSREGNCGDYFSPFGSCHGQVPYNSDMITVDVNYHWKYL